MSPKQIKLLRKALGLTQVQFAAKIGVSFATVNRWEMGRTKPSPLAIREMERIQDENRTNQNQPKR